MSKHTHRAGRWPVLLVGAITVLHAVGSNVYAAPPAITAGQPLRDGLDSWLVTYTVGGKQIEKIVTVSVKQADTPRDKALKIQIAMNLQALSIDAQLDKNDATKVILNNATKVEVRANKSGEEAKISALFGAHDAFVDYHGALPGVDDLAGVDDLGTEAVYLASFGFDGVLIDGELTFGDLAEPTAEPTIDGLLTELFKQMRADVSGSPLEDSLVLDLSGDRIIFHFPEDRSNYFVQNFTSDVAVEASVSLSVVVPQPNGMVLMVVGLVGIALFRRSGRLGLAKTIGGRSIVGRPREELPHRPE